MRSGLRKRRRCGSGGGGCWGHLRGRHRRGRPGDRPGAMKPGTWSPCARRPGARRPGARRGCTSPAHLHLWHHVRSVYLEPLHDHLPHIGRQRNAGRFRLPHPCHYLVGVAGLDARPDPQQRLRRRRPTTWRCCCWSRLRGGRPHGTHVRLGQPPFHLRDGPRLPPGAHKSGRHQARRLRRELERPLCRLVPSHLRPRAAWPHGPRAAKPHGTRAAGAQRPRAQGP